MKFKDKPILFTIIIIVVIGVILGVVALAYQEVQPKVVVVPIKGEISIYGSGASSQRIVQRIENLDDDMSVKAIILEINSPGGTVIASKEIAKAVEEADKPVIAWQREVAASGAYWISASSDYIVSDPATLTGSIGVSASYLQFAGLMDKYGIKYERLVSGTYKDTGSPFKNLTSREKTMMQEKIDLIYGMFVDHVADARNLTAEERNTLSTGTVLLGIEAKDLHLVDELGSKEEAFKAAKKLAKIEDARLVEPEAELNLLLEEMFASQFYWMGRGVGDSFISEVEAGKYVLEA